ncbi:MAG: hypothetical protein VX554_02305, partial [Candidatus Thermoplasmatota archaeon]|nr:hypothetical protein [Candidatus Thermoplasmatota archaeon]
MEALAGFLELGLKHFWACSTERDRELAIDAASVDLATWRDAGDAFAKLWACVAFEAPKTTKHSTSPVVWKQAKDQNNFIYWAHICQRHRERIAEGAFAASAAEQGVRGSLPSWAGGLELSKDENNECFELTMKHILEHELTAAQRQESHYHWDLHSKKSPSRQARSLHDVILHKYMGHKNTAHHIYQHGLPRLLRAVGAARRGDSATAAEHCGLDQPTEDPAETVQAP